MGDKFKTSFYGTNKASNNWFGLLNNGIKSRGYHQHQIDPCVIYRKCSDILTHVYDCVIVSYRQETITSLIESFNNGPENYVLTDKAWTERK